jgi:hypothetical protein
MILAPPEEKIRRIVKPSRANSSQDPVLRIPNTKKGLAEWLK